MQLQMTCEIGLIKWVILAIIPQILKFETGKTVIHKNINILQINIKLLMPKNLSQNANLCLVLIQLPSQKLQNDLFTSKAIRRVALTSDLHNDIILIHHRNVLVHQHFFLNLSPK